MSNDFKVLAANATANYQKLKAKESISLTTLKTKAVALYSFTGMLKTMSIVFGTMFNLISDNEVTLGILPLGGMGIDSPASVQEIEVTHSNKIVKFRAVGSIYLAHQVGGKDSVRIVGKLQGPLRQWFLVGLWIMTLLSQGVLESFDWNSDIANVVGSNKSAGLFRDGVGKMLPIGKVDNIVAQKPTYEQHWTFPVVTAHEIITNCYIETFSFEETLQGGKDIINYDLMLRTYTQPEEFMVDQQKSKARASKQKTKTEEVLNYSLNFMYRLIKWAKEGLYNIDTNSWKTENYYNVDAADMAFTFGLALSGVALG